MTGARAGGRLLWVVAMNVPSSLAEVAAHVGQRVDDLLAAELDRWTAVDPDLAAPIESLAELIRAGGKRLRPAFCHWGYVGAGGDELDPTVLDACAALELLHAFALVHDDVMDGSARRRGRAATHVVFEERHRRQGWRGEPRRFGEGVAILVGDLAFVYADQLLADVAPRARAVFDQLRVELHVGQYLDVLGAARGAPDLGTARRIAAFKSGKYTVERPMHMGAALAGRLDDLADPLSSIGLPLGEAFQLRDDLLGAFGDSAATGKPVGDDLREGKPTPLVAVALRRATGRTAALLGRVGDRSLTGAEVEELQQVLVATGARDEIEHRIELLATEAAEAIKSAPLTLAAQVALTELAGYVAWRDR